MSKQANKTAIGVFVVGAVVLAVAAIIAFGSGKFFVKTELYFAYFPGSVKGLRIGAPVMFRGVKIGEVTQMRIYSFREDMSVEIPVIFKVDPASFHSIGPQVENYEQQMDAQDIGAVDLHHLVGGDDVAPAFGHAFAVARVHDALAGQPGEWLPEVEQPSVRQDLCPKARVEQVHDGVFCAAHVQVGRQPAQHRLGVQRPGIIPRV